MSRIRALIRVKSQSEPLQYILGLVGRLVRLLPPGDADIAGVCDGSRLMKVSGWLGRFPVSIPE